MDDNSISIVETIADTLLTQCTSAFDFYSSKNRRQGIPYPVARGFFAVLRCGSDDPPSLSSTSFIRDLSSLIYDRLIDSEFLASTNLPMDRAKEILLADSRSLDLISAQVISVLRDKGALVDFDCALAIYWQVRNFVGSGD